MTNFTFDSFCIKMITFCDALSLNMKIHTAIFRIMLLF